MKRKENIFVHQKSKKPTFSTCFLTEQYPFIILFNSTQIQMAIVYRKTGFEGGFKDFLFTNINIFYIYFEKDNKISYDTNF